MRSAERCTGRVEQWDSGVGVQIRRIMDTNEEADTLKRLQIRMLSYNVAGIKNKLIYNDFFIYHSI